MKDTLYNSSTLAKIKRSIRLIESTMADDKPAATDECKEAGKDKPVAEADAAVGLTFPIDIAALNAAHPGVFVTDFEYETEGLDEQENSVQMIIEALTDIKNVYPKAFANGDLGIVAIGEANDSYRPALDFYLEGSFGQLMQFCYLYNEIGGEEDAEEMCGYLYDELTADTSKGHKTISFRKH